MIDRVSGDDLMSLASERGALPMQVGAIVMLDSSAGLEPAGVVATIVARSRRVPRLGQRLVSVPWGCGRPLWCDDLHDDGSAQVESIRCPEPRGDQGLLALAAELVCRPLPRDRPLWRAVVVTDVGPDRAAIVLVHHHVLADGVAGLAILSALADRTATESGERPARHTSCVLPSRARLARDAALGRLVSLSGLPASLRRLSSALRILRPRAITHASRSSLNQPTGRRRRFAVVETDLGAVALTAHEQGTTINDVLLLAVAGALHDLLATRGEDLDEVAVSMPVSDRRLASTTELGNHSGVVAIAVRTVGDPCALLQDVHTATRAAKLSPPGVSTALLAPLFRVLASVGLMRWVTMRQHLVHTFVSNLRGPDSPLALAGCPITAIVPLSLTSGNVTVSFTALSYAGRLTVSLCADPDTCPDLAVLTDLLGRRLTARADPSRAGHPVAGCSCRPSTPRS